MTTRNLETMISLVGSKYELKSIEELIKRIKEEFSVSVDKADILNLHVDLSELENESKITMYYDRHNQY